MRGFFETLPGTSLLTLLALNTDIRMLDIRATADSEPELITKLSDLKLSDSAEENMHLKKLAADWYAAERMVMQELKKSDTSWDSISDIDGLMIAADYHRLSSAGGSLAAEDIEPRAHFYSVAWALVNASTVLSKLDVEPESDASMPVGMYFKRRFFLFLNILHKLSGGLPNNHFMIDFKDRYIRAVHEDAPFFMAAYCRRPENSPVEDDEIPFRKVNGKFL
jgi:hypothetical protein